MNTYSLSSMDNEQLKKNDNAEVHVKVKKIRINSLYYFVAPDVNKANGPQLALYSQNKSLK